MQLDAFKLAAKRLRAQIAALGSKDAPLSLDSHAQSLDLLARVLGYRDFHEARLRLDQATPPLAAQPAQNSAERDAPRIIGIIGAPGCGKTVLSQGIITKALARGIPVRILEQSGARDYHHFAQALGAQLFSEVQSAEFLAAWRSDAAFVYASCDSGALADAVDFSELSLKSNVIFVCDEASHWRANFRPLGGLTLLISQTAERLPAMPDVMLVHESRKWMLQVPSDRVADLATDMALKSLLATN